MTESNNSNNQVIAQELDFEQQAVSIGSNAENDVVLPGSGVLPFHATIVLDGEYCSLIPMEPEAEIFVDGVALTGMPVSVEGFQQVEIGHYVLFFQRNGTAMRVLVRPVNDKAAAQYAAVDGESTILLNVFSGEADIEVEQTAVYQFEVVNAGPIVASFYVTVKDVPAEWVEISPDTINLNEGQRRTVEIKITPPRDPSSYAGTHPVGVIVHSPNYGGQQGMAELSLTIQPYYEYTLGNLSPKNQRIHWRKRSGMTYLPITNMSNGPADFSLMAMDDENGCTFDFCIDEEVQLSRQATTKLEAGETTEVPIQITPTKNPMFAFRNKRYHYTTNVSIPQNAGAPQVLSGSATSVPLFGWWSIMLSLATFLIAMFFILQPNIRSFDVAAGKDVIELGDTTKLLWDVSPFATRLSISNVDEPISRGQFSRTVAPEQSTTYELVSGNWLSGMFGLDQKQTVTVLVVPPTPAVNVFEVDQTTIAKGKPINVRWSVKEADEAFLTIDEVVYPLTKEEFSGEQQVVLEKDALVTLEARNASGSELQSYFVNVVPPFIDINSFAVWVRPDDGTTAPAEDDATTASVNGASKALMAKTTAPDPNFPVKFVELVADPNSETGYRVVFNPNVREELQKGEQVILEWNVNGVESLEIAPFTDSLPNHGSQPAFPQESMNFVMTAQSGELQGIYMLPIKVFDGEPPEAPKIEFFKASPSKMVGAGDSEFAWSVSGEWTRVQISDGEEIIADYLNPQGFLTINIEETKNILLTAWNGDLSSSEIIEVVVDPALIPLNLEITDIQDHSGFFYVGDTVNVFIEFTDPAQPDPDHPGEYLPPSPYPTGTVTVSDGFATCIIELPLKYCKDGFTFNAPGDSEDGMRKTIVASYSGDDIYAVVDSAPYDKQDIIVQAKTVSLSPAYYHYSDTEDGTQIGATEVKPLNKITNLNVGDGIYIDVAVRADSGPLIQDDKGQVTARYCPLNTVTNEVDLGNCVRTLAATVEVTEVGGINIGHGKIYIPHLQEVGRYKMLISYSHLDGAYESKLHDEPDDWFDVDPGVVRFWPDGLAGCTPTDCQIITRNNEPLYIFGKLYIAEANSYTPLFATYPKPEDENSTTLEVVYDEPPYGSAPIYTWANKADGWDDTVDICTWASTDKWRLECDPVTVQHEGQLHIVFADTNYLASQITNIDVKEPTEIVFIDPDFEDNITADAAAKNRVYVGEAINLQTGNVVVKEPGLTGPYLSGVTFYLAMDNQDDIGDVLEVVGGSCSINSGRLALTQTATPLTDSCQVIFKHSGVFGTTFIFEGNDDYDQSSALVAFNIQKQKIEVTWEDQGGGSLTTDREVFSDIDLQLTFDCNDTGENCDDFRPRVLRNASVNFDLSGVQGCTLSQGASSLDDGDMDLPGSLTPPGTGDMIADDLSLRCKNLGTLTVDLQFADSSNADFSIPVGSGDSQEFTLGKKAVTIAPAVSIYTNTATKLIGDGTDAVGNDDPTGNSDDLHLWIGEQYLIYASFPMPDDAVPTANDVIVLTWPTGLDSRVTYVDCLDNDSTVDNGVLELPLKQNTGDGVWEVKCVFKPDTVNDFSSDDAMTFGLDPSYSTSRISATSVDIDLDQESNIKKRPVTIAHSMSSGAYAGVVNDYYALTDPVLQLAFSDGHYQLDAATDWDTYLTVTWNSSELTCTESADPTVINCPIPDDTVVDSAYTISYTGNPSFANAEIADQDLDIVRVPVSLSVVNDGGARPLPELVKCNWETCGTRWPTNAGRYVAFRSTNYEVVFTVDAEVSGPGGADIPVEGQIKVDFGSWGDCYVDNLGAGNLVETGNSCYLLVPIENAGGTQTATAEWKFTSSYISSDLSLNYRYVDEDSSGEEHPFKEGSGVWNDPKTYRIYNWLDFDVTVDGDKIVISELPMRADGYALYAEYSGTEDFYCENNEDDGDCWGRYNVYETDGGDDDDGKVITDPHWDDVTDGTYGWQVIVKGNGTSTYLGWVFVPEP